MHAMNETKIPQIHMDIERKDIVTSGDTPPVKFVPESEQKLVTEVDPSVKKQTKARMTFRLICASKCKKYALEFAKANPAPTRAKMFSRVSEDFLLSCEVALKNHIMSRVRSQPSKGKTLT